VFVFLLGNQTSLRFRFWVIGALSGLSSLLENTAGVKAFTVYSLPKVGESIYTVLSDHFHPYVQKIPGGEIPMLMAASALLSYYYQTLPKALDPISLGLAKFMHSL
jgi:hypothetical protein